MRRKPDTRPVHRMTVLPNGTLCGASLDDARVTHHATKVTCPECRRIWSEERDTIEEIGQRRASGKETTR